MSSQRKEIRKAKVYISYSGNDLATCEFIINALSRIERENIIDIFYDKKLKAGTEWKPEMKHNLNESNIYVFLMSASFLNSEFINSVEIPNAMERADKDSLIKIVPILIEPCEWQNTPLSRYNILKLDEFNNPKSESNIDRIVDEIRDLAIPFSNNVDLIIELEIKQKTGNLDLANCSLFEVPYKISDMTWLTTLNLAFNQIKKIERLEKLTQLSMLLLDSNQIEKIEGIGMLKKLNILSLQYNRINLIEGLESLKELSSLIISMNPIENCPSDIYQSDDIKQIRAYFENQKKVEQESTLVNAQEQTDIIRKDVKLILLGNSNAGKSNIVHYLMKNEFVEENRNSTHGLEVISWKPDANEFPLLQHTNVSIWDFGGQEYYHDAYKLFLSANAVYVVVWETQTDINGKKQTKINNAGKEENLEHFEKEYWLYTVNAFRESNSNAPLLLVQNKIDLPENSKQRLSQQIIDNFSINEDFYISLKEGCSQTNPQLQRSLFNFKKEIETSLFTIQDKSDIPISWNKIREEVQRIGLDGYETAFDKYVKDNMWISVKDFIKVCKTINKEPLSENEIHTLPRWLDTGGNVVYFASNNKLDDKIFINPKILSERIYQILNNEILEKGGVFKREEIEIEYKDMMLQILISLDLVFHIESKQKYIAPQYLPEKHAIEDLFKIASLNAWQDSYWIKLPIFYYKKVMNYLLLLMIEEQCEALYYWKHGMVFIKNSLRVLIKGLYPEENEKEGIIQLSVENGAAKPEILKNIVRGIFNFNMIKRVKEKSNDELKRNERDYKNLSNSEHLDIDKVYQDNLNVFKQSLKFSKVDAEEKLNIGIKNELKKTKQMTYQEQILISHDKINFVRFLDLELNENETQVLSIDSNVLMHKSHFKSLLTGSIAEPKNIFISYSHQNTEWLNNLQIHLSGLRKSNKIKDWTDKQIRPGELWDKRITESMEQADVFICLLSADFIASEYIWDVELKKIFTKLKDKNKKVIFVYVEPFDLPSLKDAKVSDDMSEASIYDFEIIPKDSNEHLIAASLWKNQHEVLAEIVGKIRKAIDE